MNSGTTAAAKWQDWTSFALGLWLAVSPWVLGYSHQEAATANAAFMGLALALGSHFEVSFDEMSAEWFNMAAGLWLVLAPFLLGFSAQIEATVNSIAVGAGVAALASSALSLEKEVGKWWSGNGGKTAPRTTERRSGALNVAQRVIERRVAGH
jgi:SPW repeat